MSIRHFQTDYAVPPGEMLAELLEERGMSQVDLAGRADLSKKTINGIIKAREPITPETALAFERVFGVPASLWNNMEATYRQDLARLAQHKKMAVEAKPWVATFPWNEMVKMKLVEPTQDVVARAEALLRFLGVASIEAFKAFCAEPQAAYRRSPAFKPKEEATAVWLRAGELAANKLNCATYAKEKFENALPEIKALTARPPKEAFEQLQTVAAGCGVAVVVVPALKGCRASGSMRWINSGEKEIPVIQLSLRHKTDDHFWFSFFHEACHVLKHPKKVVRIEANPGEDAADPQEQEANRFAGDRLIPAKALAELGTLKTKEEILRGADKLGISPGLLVGRLQHEGRLRHHQLNDLKRDMSVILA